MNRNRRTIAHEIAWNGVGLHSGEPSSVALRPLRTSAGILCRFGGASYSLTDAVRKDEPRNTTVVFPGGESLQTVEHLLSAIVGTGLDDVEIEVEGRELPVLDGSAKPYAERILAAGFEETGGDVPDARLVSPICLESGRAALCAIPSDDFRVTYVIDYPGTALGTEMKTFTLTPERYLCEIAPARTYALLSEVEALRAAGLAKGGNLQNTLVIGDDGPLNESGYRVEAECAAHKILDLMGDLALAGGIMRAHYICICGGHALHANMASRVRSLLKTKGGNTGGREQ